MTHFPTDPDENAASIVNLAEVLFACLDAVGARTVIEVGAFHGKSTRELLDWASADGARVIAIDPAPEPALRELAAERADLELVERTSIEALGELDADAIILDGDHNYFTLSEELRLIASGRRLREPDAAADLPRHRLAARPAATPTTRRSGSRPSTASRWRATPIWSPASPGPSPAGCRSPASPPARAGPGTGS